MARRDWVLEAVTTWDGRIVDVQRAPSFDLYGVRFVAAADGIWIGDDAGSALPFAEPVVVQEGPVEHAFTSHRPVPRARSLGRADAGRAIALCAVLSAALGALLFAHGAPRGTAGDLGTITHPMAPGSTSPASAFGPPDATCAGRIGPVGASR